MKRIIILIGAISLAGLLTGGLRGPSDAVGAQETRGFQGISGITWSPDSMFIAASHTDGTIFVMDANTHAQIQELHTDSEPTSNAISWSPDGSMLAAGVGGEVYIWNTSTWQIMTVLRGFGNEVISLSWHPDSIMLAAAGGGSRGLKVWNAITGELIQQMETTDTYAVEWSPDGLTLISAGGTVLETWELDDPSYNSRLTGPSGEIVSISWHPDGSQLVATNWDHFYVWNMTTRSVE